MERSGPPHPAAASAVATIAAATRSPARAASVWAFGIALLYVTLLGLQTGCGREARRWNVLLVTFDTTRADHIGCYGNARVETPTLDRLAADGVRFAEAYSAVPITLPSHTTILTGRYPISHGVRDNGLFVVPESETTLAEILREHGYRTAAAIGSFPLVSKYGLDQGFDLYDDRLDAPFDPLAPRPDSRPRLYFEERKASRVNESVGPWLESNAGEPLFLWVHYYDPHQPLEPPAPYDQLYAKDPYDGEIAYADEALGSLLERFSKLGILDRTLVIFTSDHGEGLGEHGEATHSYLTYNATLHVPLIVRVPRGPRGRVVPERVRHVDIVPTVLDLLDLPPAPGAQGRSLGGFLAPQAPPPEADRPHYAETLAPRLANGWGELRAYFEGPWKYVHGPRPELFEIDADPGELSNRLAEHPDVAADLRGKLERFLRTQAGASPAERIAIDEESLRRLQALGYLHATGESAGTIREELREGGIAPQDRVGDVTRMSAAKEALLAGRPLAALELAEKLLAGDPRNRFYLELRALAEANLGRYDAAIITLEKSAAASPGSPALDHLGLRIGQMLFLQGRRVEGLERVEKSLAAKPDARGEYLRSTMLAAEGRFDESRAALAATLALDPLYAPARVDLAIRLAEAGDRVAAAAEFHRAIADHPYDERGHFNYAAFLAAGGETEAALAGFRRALELAPGYTLARDAVNRLERDPSRREEAAKRRDGASGAGTGESPGARP